MCKKWSDVLMKKKGMILLILLSVFFCLSGKSQVTKPAISYGFKVDTVDVNTGQTFSNLLWIENNSSEAVQLKQLLQNGELKSGLLKLPDTITVAAGQKKWLPLKYLGNSATIHKRLQDINISLRDIDEKKSVQQMATFYAKLSDGPGLVIDVDQSEIYLDPITNQARVMVRCYNNGLVPVYFRLELTEIPDGLDFIGEKTNLTLEAGVQETLPFIAKNKLNSKDPADFSVTIRALDVSGNVMQLRRLRIMTVSSDRRLSLNPSPFYQNHPNTIALRYMNVDNASSLYQVQGNGKYKLANDQQLNYQFNGDYYNNPGQNGTNIYDSYIEYHTKNWGIRGGSIYEILDFNLNGRGVKGTFNINETSSLNFYGVENNYLLYSDFNVPGQGQTFALTYKDGKSNSDSKSLVLLRNHNTFTGINTTMISASSNVPLANKQSLSLETGYSLVGLSADNNALKSGFSLGANYGISRDKISFYSNNYYSTPYYGGLRKGLLQLENQLFFNLKNKDNLSLRFSLMNNQPKTFDSPELSFLSVSSNYGNTAYEFGYGKRIKQWSLMIKPYYFRQYMEIANAGVWKSASFRTKLTVNYNNAFHDFSLDADNGYTFQNTSGIPPAPFFSSRINANYKNRFVGFTAYGQYNSYFLTDALAISENPKYFTYSFGPNTRFSILKERLDIHVNTMYNYFGFNNSESYSFSGNFKWALRGDWAVSADLFYSLSKQTASTIYNPFIGVESQVQTYKQEFSRTFNNHQIRIGIEKRFGRNDNAENKKLELVYFEDRNGNGYHDQDEAFQPGIWVKIDGLAAVTNAKGLAKFLGVKDKAYAVTIINDKGWTASQETDVFLSKDMRLEIPLVKTERLTGQLAYVADRYSEGTPSSAGLRVKAVAENGRIYNTVTNNEGEFSFYLPESKYSVSVETEGMPYAMINPRERVEVKRNEVVNIEFKYKYEQRKVDVIKFK
ncbi:carboxypeptidase-like regulatory domain-containing protein [Pedobacter sp. MC2016-24]|uniref:carboxypeptidase-like regulatory domain-containing protein n=1 Tax=Pedobacter sp. MC2016-24 TaxID=2780090 RepID=UPI001880716E|nr:carboxypeptidase-like regulatory domain-containing protein [Pedobacter sp. MC2016-24]MBE9600468.1 carboxypeptidase regulatory-like domain-containing protein [Pedobacter sp. MC2016-24]